VSVSIKPLEDRIVVKSSEAEQTTASGLVIPDTAKEKPQEGEVLAIGPGRIDDNGNRVPLDVAVGDKVIYSKYGGTEVKYDARSTSSCPLATSSRSSPADTQPARMTRPGSRLQQVRAGAPSSTQVQWARLSFSQFAKNGYQPVCRFVASGNRPGSTQDPFSS